MRRALQRLHLEWVASVVVALNVLVFAFGSSSVPELRSHGQTWRWVALGVLMVIGALYALAREGLPRFSPVPALLVASLGVLAIVSTLWSVQPRLSFERGVSFGVLLAAAGLLAYAAAGKPEARLLLVGGLVGGAALVAVAGLLVLAVDTSYSVLWWEPGGPPTRFRFLGENPNTVPLLFSLTAPAAAWAVISARRTAVRVAAASVFALLFAELVITQSRGSLFAFAAGLALVAVLMPAPARRRAAHVVAAVALIGLVAGIVSLRFTGEHATQAVGVPRTQTPSAVTTTTDSIESCSICSLLTFPPRGDEIGNPFFTGKFAITYSAVSSSGRLAAWKGAFHTANERPLAGFGFGTEDKVFVDRYYFFVGSRPENGFLGFYLQLGILGLLGFVGLGIVLVGKLVRAVRHATAQERSVSTAFAGIALAGYVAAVTQSYPYSVGNIASLTLWLAVLGLATVSIPAVRAVGDD